MLNKYAKKWIKALRSGKYKQARGQLRVGNAFCCLGVACDISHLGVWEDSNYLGKSVDLPSEVFVWLGMRRNMNAETFLIEVNDVVRLTFSQIADKIEYMSEEWFEVTE